MLRGDDEKCFAGATEPSFLARAAGVSGLKVALVRWLLAR